MRGAAGAAGAAAAAAGRGFSTVKHTSRSCRWAKTAVTCPAVYLELTLLVVVPNLTQRRTKIEQIRPLVVNLLQQQYLIVPQNGSDTTQHRKLVCVRPCTAAIHYSTDLRSGPLVICLAGNHIKHAPWPSRLLDLKHTSHDKRNYRDNEHKSKAEKKRIRK